MNRIIFLLPLILFFISCEKIIDIDLNEGAEKIVIDAILTNQSQLPSVYISKTSNFDDVGSPPTVSGALVTIIDNETHHVDTLEEIESGLYMKWLYYGLEGHTYILNVHIEGKIYTAVSTMPNRVALDSLTQQNLVGEGHEPPFGGNSSGRTSVRILPHYQDPADAKNFYQFIVTRNDTLVDDIFIRNDFGFNGSSSPFPLRVPAKKNDRVVVTMYCIDEPVYDYFFGLNENVNQSSATPANPKSNISNGALGYFKACTSERRTITIK